jgi:hypothetical protein
LKKRGEKNSVKDPVDALGRREKKRGKKEIEKKRGENLYI